MNERTIQSTLTALCAICLALSFIPGLHFLSIASVLFGSYFAIQSSLDSIRERTVDVNILMVLAAVGAVIIGRPEDAAALLFLFSLSSTLEAYAMSRTKNAIEGLVKLRPSEATLVTTEGDTKIPVEQLQLENHIRVMAFESFPVDGILLEGATSVDQSAMTGESRPIQKAVGDKVLAGTQNLEGMVIVEVKSTVGDSTLDKIVNLVQSAHDNKASGERISTWFGQKYTFFVLGAFVLSMVVRLALGSVWNAALGQSLTLLVALSPCALVISTPASTLSALTWAARRGILVRGGEFIERMGQVDAIALDKTGTLTSGIPSLKEICVCEPSLQVAGKVSACKDGDACWAGKGDMSLEARRVLRYAAAAEQFSTHPLAEAIVDASRSHGDKTPEASESKVVPGKGVTAVVEGKNVRVGQMKFFEGLLPEEFLGHVKEIQAAGMTAVVVDVEGSYAALGLVDTPRPEAKEVLASLKDSGIKTIAMLTGDSVNTAQAVAESVGITEIHAALMPEDKEGIIGKMTETHKQVMMVGDGINDAPSLARSGVGVAMGGLGSDIALNSADVVLMNDRLDLIPQMIQLGKRTNRIIMANLIFATGVIVTLTLTSFTGKLPLPIAVLGHEGSTVLVILNGLRLLGGGASAPKAAANHASG